MQVPILLTMYSMSLAAGVTDDRAVLCSLMHSSMNVLSVISGSEAEIMAESRIIHTAHSITLAIRHIL